MTAIGIRAVAREAWQGLQAALLDTPEPVPCRADPDAWTSEDPDERAYAARACVDCPLIVQCARFARLNAEQFGVWAGIDRTRITNPGRPADQRKESAA